MTEGEVLTHAFYMRTDVVTIARELLGKVVHTNIADRYTAGMIIETEAYAGGNDKASHAYGNKRTARTEVMFAEGGHAYIYLCYGIHHLFNVVTNKKDIPHAVLIRGIRPLHGIDIMRQRRQQQGKITTFGPGTASKALGLTTAMSGSGLFGPSMWITDEKITVPDASVLIGPRVGVDYAGGDAALPYRFRIDPNGTMP